MQQSATATEQIVHQELKAIIHRYTTMNAPPLIVQCAQSTTYFYLKALGSKSIIPFYKSFQDSNIGAVIEKQGQILEILPNVVPAYELLVIMHCLIRHCESAVLTFFLDKGASASNQQNVDKTPQVNNLSLASTAEQQTHQSVISSVHMKSINHCK